MVAVAAISFSAFTVAKDAERKARIAAGDIWVNTSLAGDYEKHPNPPAFNDGDCEDTSTFICAYERTNVDPTTNLPTNMSDEEIAQAVEDGLLVPLTEKEGIYDL